GASGVSRWVASAAWAMAAVSKSMVAQAGGGEPGPGGAAGRVMGGEWITPRRWDSAALANETRSWAARALFVSPARGARVRRKVIVKRRQSSGAQALNKTEPM